MMTEQQSTTHSFASAIYCHCNQLSATKPDLDWVDYACSSGNAFNFSRCSTQTANSNFTNFKF